MTSRAESAATTRAALVRAAGDLLDAGGPDAVTLRAVGARAGVSRGAPYGHFPDKEHLLVQLAVDAWDALADDLDRLGAESQAGGVARLEGALLTLVDLARHRPHLYALMFSRPSADIAALTQAAGRSQDLFLAMVAEVVGDRDARHFGALLLSSAHGIAGMQLSGHLSQQKWATTPEELVATLVQSVARHRL